MRSKITMPELRSANAADREYLLFVDDLIIMLWLHREIFKRMPAPEIGDVNWPLLMDEVNLALGPNADELYEAAVKSHHPTDDELLNLHGWTIECHSPFEIRHEDGSCATDQAAHIVLASLRNEFGV